MFLYTYIGDSEGLQRMTISLNLPEDIARHLTAHGEALTRTALEVTALEGYRSGKLSQAQVRRFLGCQTRMEVDGFLKEHGVFLEYSISSARPQSVSVCAISASVK